MSINYSILSISTGLHKLIHPFNIDRANQTIPVIDNDDRMIEMDGDAAMLASRRWLSAEWPPGHRQSRCAHPLGLGRADRASSDPEVAEMLSF